jgi:hypothetical protein
MGTVTCYGDGTFGISIITVQVLGCSGRQSSRQTMSTRWVRCLHSLGRFLFFSFFLFFNFSDTGLMLDPVRNRPSEGCVNWCGEDDHLADESRFLLLAVQAGGQRLRWKVTLVDLTTVHT